MQYPLSWIIMYTYSAYIVNTNKCSGYREKEKQVEKSIHQYIMHLAAFCLFSVGISDLFMNQHVSYELCYVL